MKALKFKALSLTAIAAICLSLSAHAQDKMVPMKKDTKKTSKMSHDKMSKSSDKMSKIKKDTTKM
ncbi:hypothetical protein [Mucilaginibacter sp. SG564]|uniref:hypothetical protein n=1 Tax=Mucilaginibacter sp. SG564 TaxID=2587022 RepID=UPI00155314A9|nr:hypothetical protein [Mucilaginibacter sp. SG564]NOW96069.1 pentapeptide MXKDX repeat protein [Mucilaginibacter sp. SG564]